MATEYLLRNKDDPTQSEVHENETDAWEAYCEWADDYDVIEIRDDGTWKLVSSSWYYRAALRDMRSGGPDYDAMNDFARGR